MTKLSSVPPAVAPARLLYGSLRTRRRLGLPMVPAPTLPRGLAKLVDEVENWFLARLDDPDRARPAARMFLVSSSLVLAGLLGAVTSIAPDPIVRRAQLASAVGAVAAEPPAPPAEAAPPAAAPPEADQAPAPPAPVAAPTPAPEPPPLPPAPPATRGALPVGKGMWIWLQDRADGGDPAAIVARARATGLTHLFVRTGTLKEGFNAGPFLDRLLPVAHAAGIRVYGWDFPYMHHPGDDVNRALAAIRYTTPDGHRIDGFSPDIETPAEGTNGNLEFIRAYVSWLRGNVGADYPLIATIPNPTPYRVAKGYPFADIVAPFDGIAPMVYWMNRDPAADVANAIAYLSQFGKPIFPVGQAYDGGPEGGPPGHPNRDQIIRFMQAAERAGAAGVSFWSWQHATPEIWQAVADAAEFRLAEGGPDGGLSTGMVRAYQVTLTSLGFPVAADGVYGPAMVEAVKAYQTAARLPATGVIDAQTRAFLLAPVAAPIRPPGT